MKRMDFSGAPDGKGRPVGIHGSRNPRILVICDYYLPGFKSGGGMRTIVNMVDRLSDRYQFYVLTRDHDGKGDTAPYAGVVYDTWMSVGPAKVKYLRRGETGLGSVSTAVEEVSPDCIYLNSVFSPLTFHTLTKRRLYGRERVTTVVAPEGELACGALSIKAFKKRTYLLLAKSLGLFGGVVWKATNDSESREISAIFNSPRIMIAPNVSAPSNVAMGSSKPVPKECGKLRAVYVSRVTPKKNLKWLLGVLRSAGEGISLDVFGDSDDDAYLASCVKAATGLPVEFKGPLPHEKLAEALSGYDLFVLPTLNENYGHVVLEALSAATPVLISDTTPWTELVNRGAGRALPLDAQRWLFALNDLKNSDEREYQAMRGCALQVALSVLHAGDDVRKTADVLEAALRGVR